MKEEIVRTKSGADLIAKLNDTNPWLLCSLIHKFGGKDESDGDGDFAGYIEEVRQAMPVGFEPKGDIYVFVDECHRTQAGDLHEAMKAIIPNAMLIGFTGTPLLKIDKKTSIEVFGPYIHTYKFDEAVNDGVVLDLRDEARDIDQNIPSPAKIDQWFEAKTKGLTDLAKAQLKQRWGTMQKVLSCQSRLEKIVADIMLDMETKDRLKSGRGNAMLVSSSIYQACKFYELFDKTDLAGKCAIVTSYKPSPGDIKGETSGEGLTERLRQYDIYNKMLGGQDAEKFEKEVKKKFIDEPGQMKLLIVVDKLLTGFDAPSATYLYIDKQMRIMAYSRPFVGLTVWTATIRNMDTSSITRTCSRALKPRSMTTRRARSAATPRKMSRAYLSNRLEKARERLNEACEAIKALCEPVEAPRAIARLSPFLLRQGHSRQDRA